MRYILECKDSFAGEKIFPLSGHAHIGRDRINEIVLRSRRVSRKHALIMPENGNWLLKDLNSKNGTFVNGRKIDTFQLSDGDVIHLGAACMRFSVVEFDDQNSMAETLDATVLDVGSIETLDEDKPSGSPEAYRDRLRILFDSLPLGIIVLDREMKAHYANRSLAPASPARHDEPSFGELIECPLFGHYAVCGSSMDCANCVVQKTVVKAITENEFTVNMEILWQGIYVRFSVLPLPFGSAQELALLTWDDFTAQKKADEALRQSEERYRSLVENTLDGFYVFEFPSGRFVFLNQRICEIFGYSQEEGLGLSVWDVIAPEEHEPVRQRLLNRVEHNIIQTDPQIFRGLRKDGSELQAEVSSSLVTYQGRPAVQGILRDVSEREKLRRELQYAQKMQAVGTLASGMAHEFNNILTSVQGFSQLLLMDADPEHPKTRHLQEIEKGCQRAAGLTRKMLTLGRKDIGKKVPVKVNAVIEGIQGMLKQTFLPTYDLKYDLQGGLPFVMADPLQLEQVFINLGVNARDAMPDGGHIQYSSSIVELDEAFCREHPWAKPGRYVEVVVEDSGDGIPKELIDRVFEPFFTTKEPGKGSGLGLAIVYSILKDHKGYILAESEVGNGSRFRVFLPVAQDQYDKDPEETVETGLLPRGNGQRWMDILHGK
jgi:PAS domain S-box-containing protein